MREDLLIAFKAPVLTTFRCRLIVVCLVDFREPLVVCCSMIGRDRFIARSSRDAICLECSAASNSARSRAARDAASSGLTLVVAEWSTWIFRFLGEPTLLPDLGRPEPRRSCNLRLVPAMKAEAMDFSSTGFLGFGPRTPRQDSVPQRHSCMFFCENGL